MPALVAERLGDARGGEGGAHPRHRRLVGGGHDDDGVREPFRAEIVLDELAHLTTALADEGDDGGIRVGAPRDHGQQRRLADSGAGEQSHALSASDGRERVDGADAQRQRGGDAVPAHRRGRLVVEAHARGIQRPTAVDRPSESVEHPAEQVRAHRDPHRSAEGAGRGSDRESRSG